MEISPDLIVFLKIGGFTLNATIVFTWIVMGLLVITAWFATRRLSVEPPLSKWQNLLEIVVTYIREQIREITLQQPDEASTITRTLFVGLAMIESVAIYCFVISIILIFANPFWNYVVAKAGG